MLQCFSSTLASHWKLLPHWCMCKCAREVKNISRHRLVLRKNVKKKVSNPGAHFSFELKYYLRTFSVFQSSLGQGQLSLTAISITFWCQDTLERGRSAVWIRDGSDFVTWSHTPARSLLLCPLTLFSIAPTLLSVDNWDTTLRKYQLHCLSQYHTPVWRTRETGTEGGREGATNGGRNEAEREQHSNLALVDTRRR